MKFGAKKILLLGFFLMAFLTSINAQISKTDSLRAIIDPEAKDTVALKTLILFAEQLNREGKFDEALKYAIVARTNSELINYRKGIAKSLWVSGYIYRLKGAYQAAINDFEEAELIYKEYKDFVGLATINANMGHCYEDLSEMKKGLDRHLMALDYAKRSKQKDQIASANVGIGINYYKRGSYEVAIEYYQNGLKISDSIGVLRTKATSLNNLGVVYEALENYKSALIYYTKSLELLQQENILPFVAKTFSNIGGIHLAMGNYKEARKNLDAAYQIRLKIGDKHQVYTLSYYGDLYRLQNKYDSAERYYNQSLRLAREMNNLEASLSPIKGLGILYLSNGRVKKSANQFELAYSIAKEIHSKPWLKEVYLYKAKVDSAQGNFKSAFTWYKQYSHLQDSLFRYMKEEKISYLESAQASTQVNSETKDKSIHQRSFVFEWPSYIYFLIAAIIISLVGVFFYRSRHGSIEQDKTQ
jgi:tetratricopeptide (TPR) repeat protein